MASSTSAELMRLVAAILAIPPDQDVNIKLDNKAVVTQFDKILLRRGQVSVRDKMRCNNYMTWAILARICKERTMKVKVSWIRGHNGREWNEKADIAANGAYQAGDSPWQVDPSAQSNFRYSAEMAGETLECDIRHVLKMQTTRRWHQRWKAQERTKKSVPDYDSVDWLGTLSNTHNNNPVHTFYSSQKDTHLRSHRIKKAHVMLPTMDVLRVRRLDLYPDCKCRLYNSATEDNEHVWIHPKMKQVQDQLREDGLQLVDY
ncbi:hypothetical protein EDD21DRAFT_355602 [Dissophora ornata]|nr:hypothetical protein BGZ58_003937 [Dissophora ornata]KAI8599275.1 hypothetical protein EDD21DRAFT_355602 [Dissophora ornata]